MPAHAVGTRPVAIRGPEAHTKERIKRSDFPAIHLLCKAVVRLMSLIRQSLPSSRQRRLTCPATGLTCTITSCATGSRLPLSHLLPTVVSRIVSPWLPRMKLLLGRSIAATRRPVSRQNLASSSARPG